MRLLFVCCLLGMLLPQAINAAPEPLFGFGKTSARSPPSQPRPVAPPKIAPPRVAPPKVAPPKAAPSIKPTTPKAVPSTKSTAPKASANTPKYSINKRDAPADAEKAKARKGKDIASARGESLQPASKVPGRKSETLSTVIDALKAIAITSVEKIPDIITAVRSTGQSVTQSTEVPTASDPTTNTEVPSTSAVAIITSDSKATSQPDDTPLSTDSSLTNASVPNLSAESELYRTDGLSVSTVLPEDKSNQAYLNMLM